MLAWPPAKFVLYAAMYDAEPFDDKQADERAAVSTALIVQAMSGSRIEPAKLFRSLAGDAGPPATDRKNLGRGFRAWAFANNPACVAVAADRRAAQ